MNPKIIITNKNELPQIIKKVREKEPFTNYKFFSINELLKEYPYTYDNKAIEYIIETKNVILEVAKIYLENITKYEIENIKDEKCNKLSTIKKELIENKLLQKNTVLENYFKKSEIYLYNLKETKYLKKLFNKFNPTYITTPKKNYTPKICLLDNTETEIAYVGEQIIFLIQQNIPIDNIYISNIPQEYHIPLKRIFKMMKIPLSLNETTTLNQTTIGRIFIENINDIDKGIEKIKDIIKTEEDESIYNQIITIINRHILSSHQKEWILHDLKNTKKIQKKNTNCIKEINFLEENIKDENYYFLLSFTKDVFPKLVKDEDYLSDKIKEQLKLDTSKDLNQLEKQRAINTIKKIKNCTITLKKQNGSKEFFPSEILESLNTEIHHATLTYKVSNKYNKYILGSLLDKYMKYKTISDTLIKLNKSYTIPYRTYQNKFTTINKDKIWQKMKNELHLSYTHLDTYNKCAFSYYIKHILKLDTYEETFGAKIGLIFHKVLEESDNENFDFDKSFLNAQNNFTFTNKELILLKNLKEEFSFTMDTLLKRKKFTSLTKNLREHLITIEENKKIKVTMKGIIDNISFEKINGETYYIIIDYKTGSTTLEEEKMPLGFHLQLPTYLYLLKKDEYFKHAHFGGFYLQPLLVSNRKNKRKENYETTKEKELKMKGFSTSNKEILEIIDSSYQDSICIKSLKVKQNGDFFNSAKILTKEEEEILEELVSKNIKDKTQNIINGNYEINPKIIDNKENISCEFCPFNDLCFHEPKDNNYLNSDKTFLKKEEENGLDERTRNGNIYERI